MTAEIIGIMLLTILFALDLWVTRITNRIILRLIDILPTAPWIGSRYRSQSMPEKYEKLQKLKSD